MAVGLKVPEKIFPVDGVRLASVAANIKKNGLPDLVVLELTDGSVAAGVFTRNTFCAAPVTVAKEHLNSEVTRALLINSGNANAGTGSVGLENCRKSCAYLAEKLGVNPDEVLPFSTGVISQQLPMEKLLAGIGFISDDLSADYWHQAAEGIMTTDTMPKLVSRKVNIGTQTITITGMSKGAGMIKPDMATMLAFIATDAKVEKPFLQKCLNRAVEKSFNAITIDGDTSTNDACILIATGNVQNSAIQPETEEAVQFQESVTQVCVELAQAIVRDGEGATKFIGVHVSGGRSTAECKDVAYTIAHSPLVKTAFFASDPNIGRLLAAVGRSPISNLDLKTVALALDEVDVVLAGEPAESYTEERGQMVMNRDEITVSVSLGRGEAEAVIWTTDLSHDYVSINAEYRT